MTNLAYGPIQHCQTCGSDELDSVLFLAFLPGVNVMTPLDKTHDTEQWFPAELLRCKHCTLVQLGYVADPAIIFPPDYPYTSGTTRILREDFADLYANTKQLLPMGPDTFVVDIGSNDGTLLKNFKDGGHKVLGIEPSLQAQRAQEAGIETMMAFFGDEVMEEVLRTHGQADIVTAANVFAHILDPKAVTANIARLMKDDGLFISESHYLLDLVTTLQYDTIYHEHLRYYSLQSIKFLLESCGLRVFKVQRIPTHGGSIRVYAAKSNRYESDGSVEKLLEEERVAGLAGTDWISAFREKVLDSKMELHELLAAVRREKKQVYAISAPSRASTLVNYVGLDDGMIPCVLEIAGSKKIGKYMPGRNIPVLEEAKLYADQPAYALLLSWHIAAELMPNLKKRGFKGDFIIPLPNPRIVRNADIAV